MTARAATIELSDRAAAVAVATQPVRGGAMKFLYASGSRPLEGFIIKRGIGRGGFGEVYFATSDAGKEVALKHIERNLEVELRGVSQCLNLKHPNLIDLYDIRYDEQGDAWVVMEYVAGPSLKDTLDRNPNGLPLDQVNFWFRGIAAGMGYLHEHGIVHRDLKPGNIFEDGGFVKIGDYGLSKFISTSRRSGQTESVGTFHYMAPEIGKGVYGKEIDIYALGIVLYELITGRTPFDGESSQEIIMKHLTADPDLSGVPQPYRMIIQRALQKDPAKRFHSAAEMVALLSQPNGHAPRSPRAAAPRGSAFASPTHPVYIGDEAEGIEFISPLQIHAEKAAAPAAGAVRPRGYMLAAAVAEEPIARAVRRGANQFGAWWTHGPLTLPIKVAVLVIAALVVASHSKGLLTAAIVLGCLYLSYVGVRMLVQSLGGGATAAVALPETHYYPVHPAPPVRSSVAQAQLSWEELGRLMLAEKTTSDHVAELTGSMLWAALVAVVVTVFMVAVGRDSMERSAEWRAGPAWLWLMTTLGTWLILAAGKLQQRAGGEWARRRFSMLLLGLVFGALAFATGEHLMVDLGDQHAHGPFLALYDSAGAPQLSAYLAYFGAVFFTIGWWKLSDPLRSSRLRIAPILLAILAAWIWQLVFPFPQPWGFLLVAGITVAVQLSAPWLSPAQRRAAMLRRQGAIA